mmetsp:Transcript_17406/g.49827  ORF Transcript_17406/g.49827 Transcript_17406/m.49827 type:complete len:263 (+) Transcript_17406:177-965(+)
MAGAFHPEWLCPPLLREGQEQILSVPEGHHFILCSMNDEYRTSYRRSIVDIGKLVPGHCEPKIERHPVGTQQGRLEDHTGHTPSLPCRFGGQIARRPRTEGSAVKDNLFRLEASDFEEISEGRLDVGVDVILVRSSVRFAVASVVVRHNVHPQHPGQIVEPVVNHAQVLGIAVREQDGHLRVGPLDEEGRDARAVRRVEPEVPRGVDVRRGRGLEEQRAYHVAHIYLLIAYKFTVQRGNGLVGSIWSLPFRWSARTDRERQV